MILKRTAIAMVCAAALVGCNKKSTDAEPAAESASADGAEAAKAQAKPAGAADAAKADAAGAGDAAKKAVGGDVTELVIEEVVVGTGEGAKDGDTVVVHYTGTLTDGTKFDSSLDRGQPFPVPLGKRRVIPGWEKGLQGMKKGGKRKLTIPPDLAYGPRGAGGVIPPNATLVFDIEMIEIQPAAAPAK